MLDLDFEKLDPESEKFSEHRETLRHVSRSRHVSDDHAVWIEERIQASVRTGSELLQKASILLPNLVFCKGARKQIEGSAASSMPLPSVLEHLFELEKLATRLGAREFNYQNIHNASPESPSTMGRFGEQRSFVCPDGQPRTFEWHLKSPTKSLANSHLGRLQTKEDIDRVCGKTSFDRHGSNVRMRSASRTFVLEGFGGACRLK